jgi:anti-sigma factor RsiW
VSDAPGAPGPADPQDDQPAPVEPADQELIPRRPGEPAWMRVIGPIRSENAAFRTVVWVAAAALTVAAIALLVRVVS